MVKIHKDDILKIQKWYAQNTRTCTRFLLGTMFLLNTACLLFQCILSIAFVHLSTMVPHFWARSCILSAQPFCIWVCLCILSTFLYFERIMFVYFDHNVCAFCAWGSSILNMALCCCCCFFVFRTHYVLFQWCNFIHFGIPYSQSLLGTRLSHSQRFRVQMQILSPFLDLIVAWSSNW